MLHSFFLDSFLFPRVPYYFPSVCPPFLVLLMTIRFNSPPFYSFFCKLQCVPSCGLFTSFGSPPMDHRRRLTPPFLFFVTCS